MFLKCSRRKEDRKEHRPWSIVESRHAGRAAVGGLMPRAVFEKLATLQPLDVRVPTTDRRELLLVRRTEPDRDVVLLLSRLNLQLPSEPPPRIRPPKAT